MYHERAFIFGGTRIPSKGLFNVVFRLKFLFKSINWDSSLVSHFALTPSVKVLIFDWYLYRICG